MSIHVALRHVTSYRYDRLVGLGPQVVRLRPAPHCRTKVLSYSMRVLPETHFINWQQDPQSNFLARLVFPEKTKHFEIAVDLVAEMAVYNPFDFFLEENAENFPFTYDKVLDHELAPFLVKGENGVVFDKYFAALRRELIDNKPEKMRTIDFLVGVNQRIWKDISYIIRLEPGVQSPLVTLTNRTGSCRDSAWLICQLFRYFGMASRFVSGYLIQLKADQKSLDGPSGTEVDFTDLHAWCEVYLPGAGWIGVDPTSGLMAGEGHLPLAATPDPQSAAPISGAVDEAEVEFGFEMSVQRIYESPRVTKPYAEEQWQEILALGGKVDERLNAGDVRLTMGGEPTFVSVDDMEGAEWNIAAFGPNKRVLSGTLVKRLRKAFGPGGLLHYGQGKWYPGESLPRWALGCYWRKDGDPIWQDDSLIADESVDYGHNETHAAQFAKHLIDVLDVDARWLMPAYEDVYYYLWKERRLPANVDPLKANLKNEEDRKRIAKVFEQGLDKTIGYVLPIWHRGDKWISGPWFMRDETLWLIPGDSPIGLRLPLDSLPWVRDTEFPWVQPHDPFETLPALPPYADFQRNIIEGATPTARRSPVMEPLLQRMPGVLPALDHADETQRTTKPAMHESGAWIIRTALCVEPRNGRLHIFMPPVRMVEAYLDLVSAVETTARELGMPVILEGDGPPRDPRIDNIKVTPDPGVIEVNMHPARSWDELTHNITTLYHEARESRLGTEKFMLDGRHTGTGGGNHIIIGGETPADSPVLRRPDLLRSLLTYWHNHPSLSYLFAGLFLGPTSQHPRVDEARNDSVRELEIAFNQVPKSGDVPPWIVDRLFRNILIDVTGNTHRTEFSIDKLYSPDGPTGRLGLVELRSFEMPPHPQMSLVQHLLLRSAVARFWEKPCEYPLVRWGTELHDRFMLPHFIWQDFCDVIEDMNEHGFPMKAEWFAPHLEFRFPKIGDTVIRDTAIELRTAIEPWHVLGEEVSAGGAARYVDSSLERLQVHVRGLVGDRFVITCNGRRVPLHPTGTVGEYVAGVRYRAWQPPSCLHPTIGIHTPLTFDLLDTWNERSLGGCSFRVVHPGGRSYDQFPINAFEAESRRLSRFAAIGHTSGKMPIPKLEPNPEFPFTLDLRR